MLTKGHSGSCVSLATYFFGYEHREQSQSLLFLAFPEMHVVTLTSATHCDPSNGKVFSGIMCDAWKVIDLSGC